MEFCHLVQGCLMPVLCVRTTSGTHPYLQDAQRTRMPPALISCVSWLVFRLLTELRGEKQKEFAFKWVFLVLGPWSLVTHIIMATVANTDVQVRLPFPICILYNCFKNCQCLSWRLYLCHNVVFVGIQFNVNLSVCYDGTEIWQP